MSSGLQRRVTIAAGKSNKENEGDDQSYNVFSKDGQSGKKSDQYTPVDTPRKSLTKKPTTEVKQASGFYKQQSTKRPLSIIGHKNAENVSNVKNRNDSHVKLAKRKTVVFKQQSQTSMIPSNSDHQSHQFNLENAYSQKDGLGA